MFHNLTNFVSLPNKGINKTTRIIIYFMIFKEYLFSGKKCSIINERYYVK
jgi:hypothetical protein